MENDTSAEFLYTAYSSGADSPHVEATGEATAARLSVTELRNNLCDLEKRGDRIGNGSLEGRSSTNLRRFVRGEVKHTSIELAQSLYHGEGFVPSQVE